MQVGKQIMMKSSGVLGMIIVLTSVLMQTARAEEPMAAKIFTGRVEDRAYVCMMQDNVQRQPGIEHMYQGKRYYLCCQGCVKGFEADPERYRYAIDPVSGDRVDKAEAWVYAYNGHAYFFSSEERREAFARGPELYVERSLKTPEASDASRSGP